MSMFRSFPMYFYAVSIGAILGFITISLSEKMPIPDGEGFFTAQYKVRTESGTNAKPGDELPFYDATEDGEMVSKTVRLKLKKILSEELSLSPWSSALMLNLKRLNFEEALRHVAEIQPASERAEFLAALLQFVRIYDMPSQEDAPLQTPDSYKKHVQSIVRGRLREARIIADSLPKGVGRANTLLSIADSYRHPILQEESEADELEQAAIEDFISEGRNSSSIVFWLKEKFWVPVATGFAGLLCALMYETSMKISRHYSNRWLLKILRDEEVQAVLNKK